MLTKIASEPEILARFGLQWVLDHLDEQTPMLVIQEIHDKLVDVRGGQANHR